MSKGKEQEEARVWNFQEAPRDAIVKAKIGAALNGLSRPTSSSWWRRIGWNGKEGAVTEGEGLVGWIGNMPLRLGGRMEQIAEI
jgi:hypothetical protein